MASAQPLETMEVYDKDKRIKCIINVIDFNPDIHGLSASGSDPGEELEEPTHMEEEQEETTEPVEHEPMLNISAEDYTTDASGSVTGIFIAHPDDARRKLRIPIDEFDPDTHTPWSQRGHKE